MADIRTEFVGFGVPGPPGPPGPAGGLAEDPLTPNHGGTGLVTADVTANAGKCIVAQGDGTLSFSAFPSLASVTANTTAISSLAAAVAAIPAGGLTGVEIPDFTRWETLGATPFSSGVSIFRVGSTLLAFGGSTNHIWTAPYNATGATPTWTLSGNTLPGSAWNPRVCLLGSTLWIIGCADGGAGIWSAPLSTPTVWTDSGATIPYTRMNAPLVISGGFLYLFKGYDGGAGHQELVYTSVDTPTTGWALSQAVGANRAWEVAAYASERMLYEVGGVADANQVVASPSSSPTTGSMQGTQIANLLPFNMSSMPCVFHNGEEICIVGGAGSSTVIRGSANNPLTPWNQFYNVVPVSMGYCPQSGYIGGDGAAYMAYGGTLYRTKTQTVYVPTSSFDSAKPYAALRGALKDGSPAIVSSHRLAAVAPWYTNHRATAF